MKTFSLRALGTAAALLTSQMNGFCWESFSTRQRSFSSLYPLSESSRDSSEDPDPSVTQQNGIDKSLLPPTINLRKESILFGENPATRSSSNSLRAWRATKQVLPFVLTGARTPHTADENPIGGFYNMIFVRLPTVLAGLVYAKNEFSGHPLVIDVGSGPTEVSPIVVATVLFIILR